MSVVGSACGQVCLVVACMPVVVILALLPPSESVIFDFLSKCLASALASLMTTCSSCALLVAKSDAVLYFKQLEACPAYFSCLSAVEHLPTKFCFHSVPFALSAHIVVRVANFSGSGAGFWRLTDLFVSTNTKPAKLGTSQYLFSIVYRYQVVSNTLHVCHLGAICSPRGLVDLFFKVACPNGVTRAHANTHAST